MNSNRSKKSDQLEAYLDKLMSDDEAQLFLNNPENRQRVMDQQELQDRIDESLRRTFQIDPRSEKQLSQLADEFEIGKLARHRKHHRQNLVRLAIAATLFAVAAAGVWQVTSGWGVKEPFFQRGSLTKIYTETVDRGFRPYYECHDQKRFADVFAKRQGLPLMLGELPQGSRMLGLSYLGGLSRDTTAMLCEVGNNKVMVFVDNLEHDSAGVSVSSGGAQLNVFRVVKNELVFYEVTPMGESTMIEHFVFPN
jgi:hypothetical protein